MNDLDKYKHQLEVLQEKIKLEEAKQEAKKNEGDWLNIGNGLEINTKQQFNGKTYNECCELAKKNNWTIADYLLVQKLRNEGHKFLKDFWVFVPQPDKISKNNNYVAGFNANSDWAFLYCDWVPTSSNASLGVFVCRKKIKEVKQ